MDGIFILLINFFTDKNNQSPFSGKLSLVQSEVSIILQDVNPLCILHVNLSLFGSLSKEGFVCCSVAG
jgi:hypothetical protein